MALIIMLLILGVALLFAETHLHTHGALAVLGIGALLAAITVVVLDSVAVVALALLLAVPSAAAGALLVVAVRKTYLAAHRRVDCGAEGWRDSG